MRLAISGALVLLLTDTVLVTHAGVIRVVFSLLLKVDSQTAIKLVIPQDQVLIVQGADFRWIRTSIDLEGR